MKLNKYPVSQSHKKSMCIAAAIGLTVGMCIAHKSPKKKCQVHKTDAGVLAITIHLNEKENIRIDQIV